MDKFYSAGLILKRSYFTNFVQTKIWSFTNLIDVFAGVPCALKIYTKISNKVFWNYVATPHLNGEAFY